VAANMIGSSKIGPHVRELTNGREQVDWHWILREIFGQPASELMPVQRAIVEGELADSDFRQRSRSTVWERR
jgi:hypothetical protein